MREASLVFWIFQKTFGWNLVVQYRILSQVVPFRHDAISRMWYYVPVLPTVIHYTWNAVFFIHTSTSLFFLFQPWILFGKELPHMEHTVNSSFIPQSLSQRVNRLFRRQFATECDLVLPLSICSIFFVCLSSSSCLRLVLPLSVSNVPSIFLLIASVGIDQKFLFFFLLCFRHFPWRVLITRNYVSSSQRYDVSIQTNSMTRRCRLRASSTIQVSSVVNMNINKTGKCT